MVLEVVHIDLELELRIDRCHDCDEYNNVLEIKIYIIYNIYKRALTYSITYTKFVSLT